MPTTMLEWLQALAIIFAALLVLWEFLIGPRLSVELVQVHPEILNIVVRNKGWIRADNARVTVQLPQAWSNRFGWHDIKDGVAPPDIEWNGINEINWRGNIENGEIILYKLKLLEVGNIKYFEANKLRSRATTTSTYRPFPLWGFRESRVQQVAIE